MPNLFSGKSTFTAGSNSSFLKVLLPHEYPIFFHLCCFVGSVSIAHAAKTISIPLKPDPPLSIDGDLGDWNAGPDKIILDSKDHLTYGADKWNTLLMPPEIRNLFTPDNAPQTTEQCHILLQNPHLRLEQIVSCGTSSAGDFWYDQEETEWVLLAKGDAMLEFEDGKLVTLQAGDYLQIPAHQKHRVASCSQDAIWLALHF